MAVWQAHINGCSTVFFFYFIVVATFMSLMPLCEIKAMTVQKTNGDDAALVALCSDLIELQRKKVAHINTCYLQCGMWHIQ